MIRWPSFLVGGAVLALVVLSAASVGISLADQYSDRRPTITHVDVRESATADSMTITVQWDAVARAAELSIAIEGLGGTLASRLPADWVMFGTVYLMPLTRADYPIRVTVCSYRQVNGERGLCSRTEKVVTLGREARGIIL